jgi:predicted membrane chloride channel (bestrophin family)
MSHFSHRTTARYLCCFICQCGGSIWWSVLPYCCINVALMAVIQWLAKSDVRIAFSIQGHTLMTLLISYLVVAKINLSYERYMKARFAIGNSLTRLRELNQLAMSYTFQGASAKEKSVHMWRVHLTERIIDLMNCTMRTIRSESQARYLSRNEHDSPLPNDDPLLHVQALRLHLYHGSAVSKLQLLERIKLMDMLNEFVVSYRDLLVLASTPLPFPLLQMGRTFLLIWTYSIPFVLREVVDQAFVTYIFVFFLTYGFIGLELVSMQMLHPFGDGENDLNIMGMREATLNGIERDLELFGEKLAIVRDRRLQFSETKARIPTLSRSLYEKHDAKTATTTAVAMGGDERSLSTDPMAYASMMDA